VDLPDWNADDVVIKLTMRSFPDAMVGQVLLPNGSLVSFYWCCEVAISVYAVCACLSC
jgi:hypothetical protein